MRDFLFRGRGADVGVRAPGLLIRLCGAVLGLAIFQLADTLGIWNTIGSSSWITRLLFMALGATLATTRAGALLWLAAGALTTVLALVLYTPLVAGLPGHFVRADPARADADAVVILSGGITHDGRITGQALDRLLTGLAEARRRPLPQVGLSVVGLTSRGREVTSEADQRALVDLVGPGIDARFVHDVHSTRDEALAFAALARTHRWRRVVAVTSPLHSRRACAALEQAGLPVECRPALARDYSLGRLDLSENRRKAFADVLYESAATAVYRTRGWIP